MGSGLLVPNDRLPTHHPTRVSARQDSAPSRGLATVTANAPKSGGHGSGSPHHPRTSCTQGDKDSRRSKPRNCGLIDLADVSSRLGTARAQNRSR